MEGSLRDLSKYRFENGLESAEQFLEDEISSCVKGWQSALAENPGQYQKNPSARSISSTLASRSNIMLL